MNYAELLQDIQDQFEDDGTEFVSEIPKLITRAENRIFKDVPNLPPFRTTATGNMVTGTATISRPSDSRVVRQLSYTNGSSEEVFLERRIDSFIKDYWPNASSTSSPLFYAEDNQSTIRIAPTPDSTYAYTVYYLRIPTGLSISNTTTELGDNYENVLTYSCFWEAAKFLEHEQMMAVWKEEYQTETAKLQQEVGRIYSNEYGAGA